VALPARFLLQLQLMPIEEGNRIWDKFWETREAVYNGPAVSELESRKTQKATGDVLRTFVIPRNQFSAAMTWRAGARTVLTLDTLQSGNYLEPVFPDFVTAFSTRVYRFDGLRRVNAGASYRLPLGEFRAARFFVRAENLAGQDYFENGFRTAGRTANGGIQFEF